MAAAGLFWLRQRMCFGAGREFFLFLVQNLCHSHDTVRLYGKITTACS
jgi:hypothetical protein